MENAEIVEMVASELLASGGIEVVWQLLEQGASAHAAGDRVSAETWGNLADAAERLLLEKATEDAIAQRR